MVGDDKLRTRSDTAGDVRLWRRGVDRVLLLQQRNAPSVVCTFQRTPEASGDGLAVPVVGAN